MSKIKAVSLAASGEMKIKWVERGMPVLKDIGADLTASKPFARLKAALSVRL